MVGPNRRIDSLTGPFLDEGSRVPTTVQSREVSDNLTPGVKDRPKTGLLRGSQERYSRRGVPTNEVVSVPSCERSFCLRC